MASAKEDAALDAAYEYVWNDYLHNRVLLAERRASPFLEELLPSVLATKLSSRTMDEKLEALANRLINVADMAHIAGAVRGDTELLRQAIAVYNSHLKLCPNNLNARRMRAETFLRLHQYDKAFEAFDEMYQNSLTHSRDEAEVAPFQLIMYAECLEDAVCQSSFRFILHTCTTRHSS
jgi:tetratricopeptide (TPR) repeat protein